MATNKCPKCKKPMEWVEGLLDNDGNKCLEHGRYHCVSCKISCKSQESKAIMKGRKMARGYKNIPVLSNQMLSLPPMEQLGILRELQKNL